MPEFIAPIIDKVLAVLVARTPALLAAAELPVFAHFGKLFTGAPASMPAVYVMPGPVRFDSEAQGLSHAEISITIKFAVAVDLAFPDALVTLVCGYMEAIHMALAESWRADWTGTNAPLTNGQVCRLWISDHDYGPVFVGQTQFARFPELHLVVETSEEWAAGVEGV